VTDREIMEALLAGKRLLRKPGLVNTISLDERGRLIDAMGYPASLSLGHDGDNLELEVDA
jgi:hypothetical protein